MWPLAIAAGVSAVGGWLGQKKANESNIELAREQMAFQERMSSTAYQRSMDDMRKAGVNPMLAIQQGGASTPGGAMARVASETEPAVNSARASAMMTKQVKQMDADISLTKDKEWSQVQERAESRSRTDLYNKQADVAAIQRKVFDLQLPALKNAAEVEKGPAGARLAIMDRIRQAIMGGRGFFNPIGR